MVAKFLPSVVRQELWSALVLLPLFRADLRVPVDPSVMASDASSSAGAICRSIGLTRGLEAARQAQARHTSLCDDEVVLFCINHDLGAGRRAGVAAFIWIGTDPHPERICRHAWPDVSVLKGDEESLSITVQSTRFSHPYVQWVFVFSGCCSSGKTSLFCQKQNGLEAGPSTAARLCLSLIHNTWPSVRALLLETSLTPVRPASFVSAESKSRSCMS